MSVQRHISAVVFLNAETKFMIRAESGFLDTDFDSWSPLFDSHAQAEHWLDEIKALWREKLWMDDARWDESEQEAVKPRPEQVHQHVALMADIPMAHLDAAFRYVSGHEVGDKKPSDLALKTEEPAWILSPDEQTEDGGVEGLADDELVAHARSEGLAILASRAARWITRESDVNDPQAWARGEQAAIEAVATRANISGAAPAVADARRTACRV
ncbi:hypothetical protein LA345_13010 [Burkholderia vietnamiensis]|uniref:Uncharacterized protein n=1 Tax=Burkholderia vietnamiensis (strain G4 / LMG 22486) TaxID=269482 RepID=A4JFL8_BURVG|nr:hypothetical protein Bcep1808_2069 [Burkholderia vietnamiensis G4]MCB4344832.1 hypothetical protein [Burkholderia vietnamiensis]